MIGTQIIRLYLIPIIISFVLGQLHSWKSGDIKMLIKADEKENQNGNTARPRTTIFDENYTKFDANTDNYDSITDKYRSNTEEKFTKFDSKTNNGENNHNVTKSNDSVKNGVDKNGKFAENSSMPTSCQLVKNVEESFKNGKKDVDTVDTVDGKEKLEKPKKVRS